MATYRIKRSVNFIWAKTNPDDQWHPLVLHMLDVAAAADAILAREPETTRKRIGEILGLPWEEARPWILFLIACHDLGKACPGFQAKWPQLLEALGLALPARPNTKVNHAFVSQVALGEFLAETGWPHELAELVADAVGCHHGSRASENAKDDAASEIYVGRGGRSQAVRDDWVAARRALIDKLISVLQPGFSPKKETLTGPDFMLLAGLASFADWIGSNEDWFPFGAPDDCDDLSSWWSKRRRIADDALNSLGWMPRTPLSQVEKSFREIFDRDPRPLQQALAEVLTAVNKPVILLVEAPMGEGKTEAAFYAHLELQRRLGHRGLYVALPTKATGNAMFMRTLKFLRALGSKRALDLQLLHGGALLNDSYQNLRLSGVYDSSTDGAIRAGEWFTNKKRALLSEYGVGTIDQALLPILPVRHNFVRLWGLANRVVIFDEIHAYDAYTGTLLVHLLRWLLSLGSSVILLSATLPPIIRRKIASAVTSPLLEPEEKYPRVSVFSSGEEAYQRHFAADPRRHQTVRLLGISPDLPEVQSALVSHLAKGGLGLALVNTVQRAQDLYRNLPDGEPVVNDGIRVGKRLEDGTEVYLLHARFPAEFRQKREDAVLKVFGENGSRIGRRILIATQVAEQSLDLDFDVIVTDLAPIDLLLQRAGRLWRHARDARPVAEPVLFVAGLSGSVPPHFGKPLWWDAVYRGDVLLRTWTLLRTRETLILPGEIDVLVDAVYEEKVNIPECLHERLDNALIAGEGECSAKKGQADQAIIGFPDDASWNDPARYVKADEDEPGLHPILVAQTRLGEESVVAIPLFEQDEFRSELVPNFLDAKRWFLRAMSLSRKQVVKKLQKAGVPDGWKKSSLLRNCFPLLLDSGGRWIVDQTVRLDDDLGLVYVIEEIE